jgi:hypothetical protein
MHHRVRSVRALLLAFGFGLVAAGPIQAQSAPAGRWPEYGSSTPS